MNSESPSRAYKQTARAKAAAETGERILEAFQNQLTRGWFEEIRLEDVAAEAGVSAQTVIRRFGGKDGLLETIYTKIDREIVADRSLPVGDVALAIDAVIEEYERLGEFVLRLLAQEDRYAPIRRLTDHGREVHRRWVGEVFAVWLGRLEPNERRVAHDRLVVALDLYVWKLLRLDMKRPTEDLRRAMLEMAAAALHTTPDALLERGLPENSDARPQTAP